MGVWSVFDPPRCAEQGLGDIFLYRASTPPHEEGNVRRTPGNQTSEDHGTDSVTGTKHSFLSVLLGVAAAAALVSGILLTAPLHPQQSSLITIDTAMTAPKWAQLERQLLAE